MQLFIQGHSHVSTVFSKGLYNLFYAKWYTFNGKSVWAVDEKQEISLLWPIQYLCTYITVCTKYNVLPTALFEPCFAGYDHHFVDLMLLCVCVCVF